MRGARHFGLFHPGKRVSSFPGNPGRRRGLYLWGRDRAHRLPGRQTGHARLRPPYPAEEGLFAKPTLVNNVETLSQVPWILRHGAAAFSSLGTEKSKGTKVFALAGKVRRGGLIEVPMA